MSPGWRECKPLELKAPFRLILSLLYLLGPSLAFPFVSNSAWLPMPCPSLLISHFWLSFRSLSVIVSFRLSSVFQKESREAKSTYHSESFRREPRNPTGILWKLIPPNYFKEYAVDWFLPIMKWSPHYDLHFHLFMLRKEYVTLPSTQKKVLPGERLSHISRWNARNEGTPG